MRQLFRFFRKDKLNRLKAKHDKATAKAGNIQAEIVNEVFDIYLDEKERKKLINDARKLCFGNDKTKRIEATFNNFSKESLDYNAALDIIDARNHIREHSQEGFFSKIGNVASSDDED